jgi:hypothetical protein
MVFYVEALEGSQARMGDSDIQRILYGFVFSAGAA